MLPAFVSLEEFRARVPGGIPDADEARAQAALDDAASLIRSETATAWADDAGNLALPTGDEAWRADTLQRVNLSVARRAFDNPEGLTEERIGAYGYAQANASPDVYLTAAERRAVRKAAGYGGLWTQPTTRGDTLDTSPADGVLVASNGTQYVAVEPEGEPLPWAGPDGF